MGEDKVQQWEYEVRFDTPITASSRRSKQERFNEMGAEGWELVSFVVSELIAFAIFKRPIPLTPQTPNK